MKGGLFTTQINSWHPFYWKFSIYIYLTGSRQTTRSYYQSYRVLKWPLDYSYEGGELTLLVLTSEYCEITRIISWLVMCWRLAPSSHRHSYYCLCSMYWSFYSMERHFQCLFISGLKNYCKLQSILVFCCVLKWIPYDKSKTILLHISVQVLSACINNDASDWKH